MPDRDAAIFEIIHRYMNKEQVVPIRRSMCPRYLSLEATERKLAEEAKFYRLQKLCAMLPPVPDEPRDLAPSMLGPPSQQSRHQPSLMSSGASQMTAQQYPVGQTTVMPSIANMAAKPPSILSGSIYSSQTQYMPPDQLSIQPSLALPPNPNVASNGLLQPPQSARSRASRSSERSRESSKSRASSSSEPPRRSRSEDREKRRPKEGGASRSSRSRDSSPPHSVKAAGKARQDRDTSGSSTSQSTNAVKVAPKPNPPESPPLTPQNVFVYIFKPGGLRKGDTVFPIIDYPDTSPLPHLFVKASEAEIK